MFIRKIGDNLKKKFVFVLRKPDGSEYENVVSANNEAEAERRLKDTLETFNSQDKIVRLKQPKND